MAIIENTSSESGDIMRIKTEVPIIGLLFLNTFTDSTGNETDTGYFDKQFRYSNDGGLNFSAWNNLTSINIQNVEVKKKDAFILEYKYTTVGTITTPLVFNSVDVSGDFENMEYPIYETTLFKQFFEVNNPKVLGWVLNVLEKLYREGILPEYIKRGDDTEGSDEDFVVFWNSITHFFALIVYFFRQYENIAGNKQLIKAFLGNKDIALPVDENLEDLSYLLYNYVDEYRKRGTERIYYKKGENNEKVNGELLRLIDFKEPDEFILGLLEPKTVGWCVGESSPTWTGTEKCTNLIKGWEYTESVEDLTKYPLSNEQYISKIADGDVNVIKIDGHQGSNLPVGIKMSTIDTSKLLKVNKGIDYEISVKVKKTGNTNDYLRFGVNVYNETLQSVTLKSITNRSASNSFYSSEVNNTLPLVDQYYWLRGVLYADNTPYDVDKKLNFINGRGLVLNSFCTYMSPYIYSIGNADAASVQIYDIKVRPLDLPFSQGQLGIKNIIVGYLINNGELSFAKLKQFIQQKLIPYNSWIKLKETFGYEQETITEDIIYLSNFSKVVYPDNWFSESLFNLPSQTFNAKFNAGYTYNATYESSKGENGDFQVKYGDKYFSRWRFAILSEPKITIDGYFDIEFILNISKIPTNIYGVEVMFTDIENRRVANHTGKLLYDNVTALHSFHINLPTSFLISELKLITFNFLIEIPTPDTYVTVKPEGIETMMMGNFKITRRYDE